MKNTSYIKCVVLAFVSILFLGACSSNSRNDNVPEWVLNPIQDDQEYFYGVGVAATLEAAKQHALKEIASKFSVRINSETLHKQTLHNGQADQLFSQNINTYVKDIEFNLVEQKKAEKVNQQYFVQVALSRIGFIKDNKSKLSIIIDDIDVKLNNINSKSKIEQLYAYNQIQEEVTKAEPLLYLIAVADPSFDLAPYARRFQQYSIAETQLLSSTYFYIQSSQNLLPIAEQLNDLLQTQGLQISSRNKADAIIQLQGKIKNTQAFSAYNVRINVSFLVKSTKGSVYSKKSYLLNGSSVTSHQRAYESAVSKFLTVVESRSDIYELLGFND
ncbi:LPP20 family lipoprotein [Psychromonas sp. L1A2]|uniref:LPP20 family lipoprotein n=1 Tax=Psychromonas sp. L1A2 TaxID=2686356 RepID=UPI00135728D4|nr:LPP20 family lipoprotein [Psychromonas sp. L1A2]